MYLQLTRGKSRGTDAAGLWFIGQPRLVDAWAIRWMTPLDTYVLGRQNVWYNVGMMLSSLASGAVFLLTHCSAFSVLQWTLIALQLSIVFVSDRGVHRSLPTLVAEWWLRRCSIVKIDESQALLAIGAALNDKSHSKGKAGAYERTRAFLEDTRLETQVNAYLEDLETREWETVLDTAPTNSNVEDEQIAAEVREQLVDRARAVIEGDWPLAFTSSIDDTQVTTWRLRATKATGDANWHPTARES